MREVHDVEVVASDERELPPVRRESRQGLLRVRRGQAREARRRQVEGVQVVSQDVDRGGSRGIEGLRPAERRRSVLGRDRPEARERGGGVHGRGALSGLRPDPLDRPPVGSGPLIEDEHVVGGRPGELGKPRRRRRFLAVDPVDGQGTGVLSRGRKDAEQENRDGSRGSSAHVIHLVEAPKDIPRTRLECAPASMPLTAGTRLGLYEILAPIGAGGMGEVYRARDPKLKRDVAIKVLPTTYASDEERLRRFEQEAQAAGALNHPNITAVYELGSARRLAVHRHGASRGRDAARPALGRRASGAQGDRLRDPDRRRASPRRTRRGSCTAT